MLVCDTNSDKMQCIKYVVMKREMKIFQNLTNDIFVMLRDELLPVSLIRRGEVDVDESVTRCVQVGLKSEQGSLIGHVFVLRVKVVNQLYPGQKS